MGFQGICISYNPVDILHRLKTHKVSILISLVTIWISRQLRKKYVILESISSLLLMLTFMLDLPIHLVALEQDCEGNVGLYTGYCTDLG
jgi:hypothetical protein